MSSKVPRKMRRLFFFVLLVLLSLPYYVVHYRLATPVAAPGPFDYFKLSLQWPPTLCSGHPRCPRRFTIHGLWPDNFQGPTPQFCDNTVPFTPFPVGQPLYLRLKLNWPDVIHHQDRLFWSRQWRKHGTCSLLSYNQTQYFTLALDSFDGYDVDHHFQNHHITPGAAPYSASLIRRTIISLTSKRPDLLCVFLAGRRTLREVRICFSQVGTIDCPARRASTSCSGNIYFPQ